jgi:hypothetical protein
LHKLNAAAEEVNKHLTDRNFMMVTTSAYNFWLYELCDVYIVSHFLCWRIGDRMYVLFIGGNETND